MSVQIPVEKPTASIGIEQKICPFSSQAELKTCLAEKCALFVRVWNPVMLTDAIPDPENIMVFEGCGLVNTPSWEIMRKPKKVLQP
jgi:hypothetical protein